VSHDRASAVIVTRMIHRVGADAVGNPKADNARVGHLNSVHKLGDVRCKRI
jgi:hypothetical protein